jgi:hypothetical protein
MRIGKVWPCALPPSLSKVHRRSLAMCNGLSALAGAATSPQGRASLPHSPPSDVVEGDDGNQFGARSIAVLPTMRYPVDVRWHQDLVYNAVWSLLVEVRRWNAKLLARGPRDIQGKTIERVLTTGLGKGYGNVSVAHCAQQMVLAIRHFAQGIPEDGSKLGRRP